MLAQNFKTAADLRISDDEHVALVRVLGMLERGELIHFRRPAHVLWDNIEPIPNGFNMETQGVSRPCGTVACIGGWVAFLLGQSMADYVNNMEREGCALHDLYWGHVEASTTPAQAAAALRNYLTLGVPNWNDVINGD